MTGYIDKIMTNHVFNSESSEDLYYLYSDFSDSDNDYGSSKNHRSLNGGTGRRGIMDDDTDDYLNKLNKGLDSVPKSNDSISEEPNGGFPPIYIIERKQESTEKSLDRQITKKNVGVSIKDILRSKK